MVHLNITMPEDVAEELKHIRNKSQFIAHLLKEKFEQEKKEKLGKMLRQAYQQSAMEDKRVNKEWEDAALEGWPE